MAQNSKIEWTHHTANLWHGCTKVHEGCDHCYAETLSKRWGRDIWGNDKPRMEIKSVWNDLKKYQQMAAAAGEIHRVFVGSMMDIFEKPMPLINSKGEQAIDFSDGSQIDNSHLRERFFNETIPQSPNLLFLLLTKRPSNINKYIPESWKINPPENVMFGTSPVNQATADKLIPQLLQVKGRKFLSMEPLLSPVDLNNYLLCDNGESELSPFFKGWRGIDWVICGGESGHGARPMHPEWARSLRDQCKETGTPFLFKQWGEWLPKDQINLDKIKANVPYTVKHRNDGKWVKLGKKEAGRMLDGVTHDEFPKQLSLQNQ
jgi:protein gp37